MEPDLFNKLPYYVIIKCLEYTGKFIYRNGVIMSRIEENDERYNLLSKVPIPIKIKCNSYSILLHDKNYKINCTLNYSINNYENRYDLNIVYSKYSNDYNINYVYQVYYIYNKTKNIWEQKLKPITYRYC